MPVKLIPVHSELKQNELLLNKSPFNNKNNLIHKMSSIENNTITIEKKSRAPSSLRTINAFFNQIKDTLSWKKSTPSPTDIELDNILAQGRMLSHDSDTIHQSLKNRHIFTPDSSLSLTAKAGIALGSVLVTSTLVGSGFYYFQRAGRGQYHEFRNAADSNLSSVSPYPPSTYHPLYSHSPDDIPSTLSERQDTENKNQINNELINSKWVSLITVEESQSKKTKRQNIPSPCNNTEINQNRDPISFFYTYSTRQLAVCLTESFDQLCQKTHQNARNKHGCFFVPRNLVLKITDHFCMCPPPDWLELIIVTPTPEFLRLTNPPMILIETQPTAKSTTTTTFTPTIPAAMNTTQRYSSQANTTVPPKKSSDKPELFTYANERERERANLVLSKNLRRISEIIVNPVATALALGKAALGQEDADNTLFYQTVKKIETVTDNILMWIPVTNRAFISANIVGDILNLYSDALEGKKIDAGTLSDLALQIVFLSQDIISSISTADIKKLSNNNIGQNKKLLHPFFFEKNNLMMTVDEVQNKIKIEKKFNHLYDSENDGFIFYDYNECWMSENYKNLNIHIKDSFEAANKVWNDPENIYFFKNSSPAFYENGVIIRYRGGLYLSIKGVIHAIEERELTDDIYRYVIKNGDEYTPVIYQQTSWAFEKSSSPVASHKLCVYLKNNHSARNNLVSKTINHQDVSPLARHFNFQIDKNSNKYLKINDQYYMIKTSKYGKYYIEGSHDILELQYANHQYHIKRSPLDNTCCFYRKPINTFKGTLSDPHFFLDKKVLDDIKRIYSLPENKINLDINEIFRTMRDSKNIDKAITANGIDYILCDDKFIQISSNGDDTYIIGDPKNNDKNILVYRNKFSDTYFKIPRKRRPWYQLIEKPAYCRVKRQPGEACAIDYYESHNVGHILEQNDSQSITINDYEQQLESHDNSNAIYQEKGNDNNLYYKVKENTFFHVRKNLSGMSSVTPSIFIMYGKNANQQIDLDNIITRVCVIRDFDTKKIIFSTPDEAQDTILNIPQRLSKLFLKVQEQDRIHRDITPTDLAQIKERQSLLDDMTDLRELFLRSGKKILSSIEHSESILKQTIDDFLLPEAIDNIEINNLKHIEQSRTYPVIEEVCNNALKTSISNIDKAIATMEESKERLNQYIIEQLGISDARAVDYFTSSFKKKLERIKMYFNESNKENIMIITKKKQVALNKKILSEEGKDNLGFSIPYDPLDRIFINTAIMKDFTEQLTQTEIKSPSSSPVFWQPDSPRRNSLFFTNLISDTMIHESVHVLGSPDDYLYLRTNKEGKIKSLKESIAQIESSIKNGKMRAIPFNYFSKLYFMSNPIYKDFSFASLSKPKILVQLFREDSFYRAIFLLKNPDTVSLLIRELATPGSLDLASSSSQ